MMVQTCKNYLQVFKEKINFWWTLEKHNKTGYCPKKSGIKCNFSQEGQVL